MKNIEMLLPEFAKMVHYCVKENKTKPKVIFCHDAFDDSEIELLGSALKYCSLRHINVIVIGSNDETGEPDTEVDATDYDISEIKELGKKVKKLAYKHKSVKLFSDYFRICENCGITIEEIEDNNKAVTFTRQSKNQNYYMKKDGKEKIISMSINEVKEYRENSEKRRNDGK
jgi:hypothetical protein